MSAENLIHRLLPHQGCVITRTAEGIDIAWEIRLDRMKVTVDGEVRFEGPGDYAGLESTPSVGPCFGSTVSIREFSITPLA